MIRAIAANRRRAGGSLPEPVIVQSLKAQTDPGTTPTISMTCASGTNRKLLVCLSYRNITAQAALSVTYNGVSLTAIGSKAGGNTGSTVWLESQWFYLDDASYPANGTYNIVGTISTGTDRGRMVAYDLTGAHQGTPEAEGHPSYFTYTATTASCSSSLTTIAANALLLGFAHCSAGDSGAVASCLLGTLDLILNGNANSNSGAASYDAASPGAQTQGFTWTSSSVGTSNITQSLVSVAPA